LLSFVPTDTAVCLVIQGLREKAKTISESPFADWAAERIETQLLSSAEYAVIRQVEKMIRDQIGLTVSELRDDILGDAIVLTYQPGPPEQPDAEQGTVILKARSPDKLRKLIDRLNQLQQDQGEIKNLKEVDYRGATYIRRVKADGTAEFYYLRNGLFVFSGQEAAIQQVLDRAADTPKNHDFVSQSLRRLGVENRFVNCWVNPRKLDHDLKTQIDNATDAGQRAFLTHFAKVWAAIDGLAISLDIDRDVELGLSVTFNPLQLPAELQPLLASPPTRSAVWQMVPEDALFAIGGRLDLNALITAIASFAPTEEQDAIRGVIDKTVIGPVVGRQNLPAIRDAIGPDWGMWSAAPSAASKSWVPEWTVALRVRETNDGIARRGILRVLGFWLQMIQYDYNQKHEDQIELRDVEPNGVSVTYLVNEALFPPGFRPSFAVKDGYLVVTSSPELVQRFTAPTEREKITNEVPILRGSGTAIRSYLQTHGQKLGRWLADVQSKDTEEVFRDLGKLADILELVNRVELLVRGDEKRFELALQLQLVKPLK
jgi:hypothetical protein